MTQLVGATYETVPGVRPVLRTQPQPEAEVVSFGYAPPQK